MSDACRAFFPSHRCYPACPMRQLLQDPKSGKIQVVTLPAPALVPGAILVRTVCSAISPGTERAAISTVRDSYLRTARARPDLVRRVLDTVKREGVLAAYRKVQAKLAEPRALGYSCAGVVEAVGDGMGDLFRVGDRVACAGMGVASHAEVNCVPSSLAARIPDGVPFEAAAFTTLGAIALHGVRQAEPTLGERFAVIGLGILGLLTVQILRAHGVRVAAFDLSEDLVERAKALGAEAGIAGAVDDQVQAALAWTEGLGVDAAIVTAASASEEPMLAAAGMCRDRGRVVAVGLVPFGLPREIAYVKELELRISRSYGPGRYDRNFEEKGIDYPPGYVRWTETRNMEAFLHLLRDGRVDLSSLITHRFQLDEAPAAYEELMTATGRRPLGMLIDFPEGAAEALPARRAATAPRREAVRTIEGRIGVAFLGAGAFARAVLLPQFRARGAELSLRRVVTAHGLTAADAGRRFGFEAVGTDPEEVLADPAVHLVCIATRHDLHASLVARALRAGKHVFVEKPLALDDEQLRDVEEAASSSPGLLLVGFNRRFSPMGQALRDALASRGPILMQYRVNAGVLPDEHWLHDPDLGGGRIIGEGCHFVDFLSSLAQDAEIVDVQALSAGSPRGLSQDVAIQLAFADGSVGQIVYTARGNPALPKERVEAHAGGCSAWIDDYRECRILRPGRSERVRRRGKGHAEEIEAVLAAVRAGGPSPIPLRVLLGVMRGTFAVHRALRARPSADAGPGAGGRQD